MERIVIIGFMIIMAAGFHSCTPDEFLEPTTVDLQIKMVNTNPFEEMPGQANNPSVEFNEGTFRLSGIEFDGKRENNDNHYFFREFDNMLVADLSNNSLNQKVTFDIPRGSYNPIQIKLHINGTENSPGLRFRGKWKKQQGRPGFNPQSQDEIPVEINFFEDIEEEIKLTVNTEAGIGNEQILFDEDNWNTLEIRINMAQLFRSNPGIFEKARIQGEGQNQKIIISRYHNNEENMYYSLVNRVEKSIKAVIK